MCAIPFTIGVLLIFATLLYFMNTSFCFFIDSRFFYKNRKQYLTKNKWDDSYDKCIILYKVANNKAVCKIYENIETSKKTLDFNKLTEVI